VRCPPFLREPPFPNAQPAHAPTVLPSGAHGHPEAVPHNFAAFRPQVWPDRDDLRVSWRSTPPGTAAVSPRTSRCLAPSARRPCPAAQPPSAGMSSAFRRGTARTDKGIGVHRHLLHHRRDSELGRVSCCRGGVRALARPSMARRARKNVFEAVDVPGMVLRVWSGRAGGEWCAMKERLRDVSRARFACAALLSWDRWPRREPRAAERTVPSARAPCLFSRPPSSICHLLPAASALTMST
jgi:hypothetical protein